MTDKQLRKLKIEQICRLANIVPASAKAWLDSAESHKGRGWNKWITGMYSGHLDTARIVWDVSQGKYLTKLHKALM